MDDIALAGNCTFLRTRYWGTYNTLCENTVPAITRFALCTFCIALLGWPIACSAVAINVRLFGVGGELDDGAGLAKLKLREALLGRLRAFRTKRAAKVHADDEAEKKAAEKEKASGGAEAEAALGGGAETSGEAAGGQGPEPDTPKCDKSVQRQWSTPLLPSLHVIPPDYVEAAFASPSVESIATYKGHRML